MARSFGAITGPRWPGVAVVTLVLTVVIGTLAVVILRADHRAGLGAADIAAIRFTVFQAFLSALLSVFLAVPVARALSRRSFFGRQALITLLGAPFILPVIVAVLGLLAVFGRQGVLNQVLVTFGMEKVSIYGLSGILLAHVFLNLPLAVRMILLGWQAVPAERFRLVAALGASTWSLIEWPMLQRTVPSAFAAIFLICLTSFSVALILGGGPNATTVELAIYQAVRFEFALDRAALLASVQCALSLAAAVFAWRLAGFGTHGAGLGRPIDRFDGRERHSRVVDMVVICALAIFLLLPMALIIWRGVGGLADLPDSLWPAIRYSILVAGAATFLTTIMAVFVALRGGGAIALASALPMAASALVVGTGLFIALQYFGNPTRWALVVTSGMNALLALPFAIRIIAPAVQDSAQNYGRLAAGLGIGNWRFLWLVILPLARRPLGFAMGLTAAMSVGDLGVIALFSTGKEQTLPLLMYQLMGSYRTDAAWGAALVLLCLAFAAFAVFDFWGRRGANT